MAASSKFNAFFKGKCKDCPCQDRSRIEPGTVLCWFGGIRELDQDCNIRRQRVKIDDFIMKNY